MARHSAPHTAVREPEAWTFSHADVLWLAGSLAQLHRIPADLDLLGREFPPPHDIASVHRALRAVGLTTAERAVDARGVARLPLPCIAFVRAAPGADDSLHPGGGRTTPNGEGAGPPRPALLVKTDGERLLYFAAGSEVGETLRVKAFSSRFEARIITVARKTAVPSEADCAGADAAEPARPYGFHRLIAELRKHRHVLRDVVLASAAIQLIGLATPLFTQVIIDKVVVHQTLSTLSVVGVGLALFAVFGAAMTWLRQYLVLHTGNRIDAVLAAEVFGHLVRLPFAYYRFRPTGTLVARLQAVESVREFVTGAAVALVLDLPMAAVFLAVMFFYSWQLSLIALALTGAIAVLSAAVTPRLRRRLNEQFLLGARNQAFVTEHVMSMETVKALQLEPRLEARYGEYLSAYLGAAFRTRRLANSYNVAAAFLDHAQVIALLVFGALLVMENTGFTVGMLVAFQMFATRLSQPVLRLAGLYQQMQEATIAVKRIADIMDAPAEPRTFAANRVAAPGAASITIRGLGFRHEPHLRPLFSGFDADVQAGHTVAITGPSGAGKSTLAHLLLGFYAPTEGQIRIDGVDQRHLGANELRRSFGVVPQETQLFSDSIYGNLLRANPHASLEEVIHACKLAEIHDAIEMLPKGYQTEIGERGVGLSGGQKQRIAIARALLKRPRILLFDEATASLDADTAERIARTINRLRGQVTVIFIAHQLPAGLCLDRRFDLGAIAARAAENPVAA